MLSGERENIRMEQFCGKDEFILRCFDFDALTGRCPIDRFMNLEFSKIPAWQNKIVSDQPIGNG